MTIESLDRTDDAVSRRRLLRLGGLAAAGAVGATVVSAAPAGAVHQPEDIGMNMVNTGTTTTQLTASVSSGSTFYGVNSSSGTNGIGLHGDAPNGYGKGVYGTGQSGFGVQGFSPAGSGVAGRSTSGTSLLAMTPGSDSGNHLTLSPASTSGPPTSGNHLLGQFWMDSLGVLYQCVTAGIPGTWKNITNQEPELTGPEFRLLSAPVRMYDSRHTGGALGANQERVVPVTNGTTIPTGISAVLVNLTAVNPSAKSYMAIFQDGITWPGHSNLNYAAGATISNNATSAVSAASPGKVKVRNGASTSHFIVDVFAYYTAGNAS
jgi:hypothetical protein